MAYSKSSFGTSLEPSWIASHTIVDSSTLSCGVSSTVVGRSTATLLFLQRFVSGSVLTRRSGLSKASLFLSIIYAHLEGDLIWLAKCFIRRTCTKETCIKQEGMLSTIIFSPSSCFASFQMVLHSLLQTVQPEYRQLERRKLQLHLFAIFNCEVVISEVLQTHSRVFGGLPMCLLQLNKVNIVLSLFSVLRVLCSIKRYRMKSDIFLLIWSVVTPENNTGIRLFWLQVC